MVGVQDALDIVKIIEEVMIGDRQLSTRVAKIGEKHVINVTNVPSDESGLDQALTVVEGKLKHFSGILVEKVGTTGEKLTLRYPARNETETKALVNVVGEALGASGLETRYAKKAAVVVRSKSDEIQKKVATLLGESMKATRVQIQPKGKGSSKRALVIGYFAGEGDALEALKELKKVHGVPANFKRLAEPVVKITGLPSDASEEEVAGFFELFAPAKVTVDGPSNSATVVLNSPSDVKLASDSLSRKEFRQKSDQISVVQVAPAWERGCDLCIEIEGAGVNAESILSQLGGVGNPDKSTSPSSAVVNSPYSAFVAFKSVENAIAAANDFNKGNVNFNELLSSEGKKEERGGSLVTSKLTVVPTLTLECVGLEAETPASTVLEALSSKQITPIGISRSAILKFKRNADVVPAIKDLKTLELEGEEKLRVERFRNFHRDGDSDYDESGYDEMFDRWSLQSVMKDYLGADPGLRMQIAKNAFERAMTDAQASKDITWLLENNSSASIKQEAMKLLKGPPSKIATNRLFDLFLQREDMVKFAGDFREMTAFFGEADSDDPFNWSEFKIDGKDDILRLREAMNAADSDAALYTHVDDGGVIREKTMKGRIVGGRGEVMVKSEGGDEGDYVKVSLEDPSQLMDRDGRVWSGCILNTDTVQKTMPGNRVLTHRALVVIGNLRGAAGFGMGKGQTPPDAINAAFRSALRNLTHIDLFDNYGLAHDLHGKHNSCHAYIKATPRSRIMVASPFAQAILTRFGISSASVKIVGRRDPYAQVRAVFNAVAKHENVDEFARDRGQRYLDLRWAYDKSI